MFKLIRQHDYSEAYNIFYQNNYVGPARIRHGYFRMDDGIVWWRDPSDPDCDKVKIKTRDFGLRRVK